MRRSALVLTLAVLALAVPAAANAKPPARQYYISLGDSYAVGYQGNIGRTTLHGPANQLVKLAAQRGHRFTLVNYGCAGATTKSMLTQRNCPADGRMPGAPAYPGKTQVQAAAAFMRAHPGTVGLVTISIGGNDIYTCIPTGKPIGCVAGRMPTLTANLKQILRQLRAAGGRRVQIIGSTYPDVVLGAWVRADVFGENRFALATQSLTAFRSYINPGLAGSYRSAGGQFVDVTAATGAYGPFVTTNAPTYGIVPVPVATVCRLTFFCSRLDIHMTTAGYGIIARLEANLLAPLRKPQPPRPTG